MLLQLLCGTLFLSVVAGGDDTLYFKSKHRSSDVICPDHKGTCPDGSTCCLLNTGKYGCCPLPQAVCCSDHLHCCPNGYKCDPSSHQCNKGALYVKWHTKTPATPMQKSTPTLKTTCPGGLMECPQNNTCCQIGPRQGVYGCCPVAKGVCCADRLHCCPANYKCDAGHKFCVNGDSMLPWLPVNMKTAQKRLTKPPKVAPLKMLQLGKTTRGVQKQPHTPTEATKTKLKSATKQPLGGAGKRSAPVSSRVSGATTNTLRSKPSLTPQKSVVSKQSKKGKQATVEGLKTKRSVDSKVLGRSRGGTAQGKKQAGAKGGVPQPSKVNQSPAGIPPKGKGAIPGKTTSRGATSRVPSQDKVASPAKAAASPVKASASRGKADSQSMLKLRQQQKKAAAQRQPQVATSGKGLKMPKSGKASAMKQTLNSKSKTTIPKKSVAAGKTKDMGKKPAEGKATKPVSAGTAKSKAPPKSTPRMAAAAAAVVDKKKMSTNSPKSVAKSQASTEKSKPGMKTSKAARKTKDSAGSWWLPSMVRGFMKKIFGWPQGKQLHRTPHVKIGSSTGVMSKAGIVCPGGKARCPKATTCCQLKSGSYGCCPMVEATCCKDHIHCCPKGSTCNLQAGTCDSVVDKTTSKLQKKFSAHSLEDVVICPDSKSTCPSGSTCCKMQSGEYGCCPMPKAVCCSDHLHCCPSGTTCDVAKGACNRGMYSIPWQKKTPAVKTGVTKGNTACPGGGSCPDGATCCKMPSGKYGCCPYAKAVCCKDLISCCPHGTTCDPTSKKCDSPGISTSWSGKNTLTLSGKVKAVSVICPDQSTCPTSNTCCQMKSGKYGCCPMDQAVCCSDHVHCCPHKTTCDVSHQRCLSAGDSVPWSVKLPARPVSQGSTQVVCPDKKSSCPSGQTCCLLKGGVWGCCPMPKAVCCKDGLHCCPESTTCDIAHGRCNSITNSLSISWTMVKRMSALTFSTPPPLAITCPDKSMCPGVSTCCLQSSGRYGCCPLLNATCCADKLHCCPSGFKCQGEKCVRQGISVPMSQHTRHASKMPVGGTAIKCPDSNMECPDGTTCCKILKTKKYGCCPKPNAVCCADGIHCCPQGTKCDDKAGACVKAVPWSTKVASRPVSQKSNSVICPDQKHECPDMNTCCRLSTGEWGCCPLPKAVCCADGKHCCPHGYTCDPTTAICNPGGNRLPRTAARLVAAVQGRYRVKN